MIKLKPINANVACNMGSVRFVREDDDFSLSSNILILNQNRGQEYSTPSTIFGGLTRKVVPAYRAAIRIDEIDLLTNDAYSIPEYQRLLLADLRKNNTEHWADELFGGTEKVSVSY